jgi:hypothetical protein
MAEAKKKEAPVDYYVALGVEKAATAQEITVMSTWSHLAILLSKAERGF